MAAKCRREEGENGRAGVGRGVRARCWKSRRCGRNVGNAGHAAGRPPGLMARVQRQELLHPPWGRARAAARHPPPPPAEPCSQMPRGAGQGWVSPGTYSVPGVWPRCPGCSPGFPGSCWPAACSPIPTALVQNNQSQLRFKYKIWAGGSGKSLVSHGNSQGTLSTHRDGDTEGPSPFRSRLKSWSRRISQSLLFLMAFSKASRLEDALTRFS